MDNYRWFLYLGILFFIMHLWIYGFGLNLSYFGLILIYIGYFKPVLSSTIKNILWVLILLDIIANFRKVYEVFFISSSHVKEIKEEPVE